MHANMTDRAVRLLERTQPQGAVAEFGVYLGHGLGYIGQTLKQRGLEYPLFGFDTFEGMPASEVRTGDRTDEDWRAGSFADTGITRVEASLRSIGVSATLIKGLFDPSVALSSHGIDKIAMVHIDADIYEGYRDALTLITDCLQPGSVLLMDESEPPADPETFFGVRNHGQRALHAWWSENDVPLLHIRAESTVALYVVVDRAYLQEHGRFIAIELMGDSYQEFLLPEVRVPGLDESTGHRAVLVSRSKALRTEIDGMLRSQENRTSEQTQGGDTTETPADDRSVRSLHEEHGRLSPEVEARVLQHLCDTKREQIDRFQGLTQEFAGVVEALGDPGPLSGFVAPYWLEQTAKLERELLPEPPLEFLRRQSVLDGMHVAGLGGWYFPQLEYLTQCRLPDSHRRHVLEEDPIGAPVLYHEEYMTSHHMIHQLCHFLRFERATRARISSHSTIIEWGGGYGTQAKLFGRLHAIARAQRPHRYYIIDLPLMSALQWLYLTSVLGPQSVHLARDPSEPVPDDAEIVLVPLTALEAMDLPDCDIFLSTWALSESTDEAQDYVVGRNWFGARRLLLAGQTPNQSFPFSERMAQLVGRPVNRELAPFVNPPGYYLFA